MDYLNQNDKILCGEKYISTLYKVVYYICHQVYILESSIIYIYNNNNKNVDKKTVHIMFKDK